MNRLRQLVERLDVRNRVEVPADVVIARNEHGRYAVPRAALHRPAAQVVVNGGVWERETVDLLRGTDPRADVVHAGTFFGDFLPAVVRSRRDGAKVWAFEPSAENFRCAELTVRLNRLVDVELVHAALDAGAGTGRLEVATADGVVLGGAARLLDARADGGVVEDVPLVAVDDVVPAHRHVAVVQLDVEGHEQDALSGALSTIRRCRPLLVLESPPGPEWFDRHLADVGYRVTGRVADNTVLTPAPGP